MGWNTTDIPDQRGKIAIVTGANSGLGREASRELARKGATVVMAVRHLEKGQRALDGIEAEIPAAKLELGQLDLGSLASVHAFVDKITAEHPVIDILLNNAGIMAAPPSETVDGFESQVGINHFGHFVLTEGLMAALQQAPVGRVVTLTSTARMRGRPLSEEQARLSSHYDAWQAYAEFQAGQLPVRLGAGSPARGFRLQCLQPGGPPRSRQHQPAGCQRGEWGRRVPGPSVAHPGSFRGYVRSRRRTAGAARRD